MDVLPANVSVRFLAAVLLAAVAAALAILMLPSLALLATGVFLAVFLVGLLSPEYALFLVVLTVSVDTVALICDVSGEIHGVQEFVVEPRYCPFILPLLAGVPGWLAARASHRLPRRTPTPLDGLVLFITGYELLSILWGPDMFYSSLWMLNLVANLLLYFFVTALVRDGASLRRAAVVWIVSGTVCAAGVVASKYLEARTSFALTDMLTLELTFGPMGNRPSGFAGHNHAAGFCAMAMAMAAGVALEQRRFAGKLLYFGQALFMLAAVIMTESRGAMIGSLVAGVFFIFMHPRLRKSVLRYSLGYVAVVAATVLAVRPGMFDRLLIGFGYTGKLYFSEDKFFSTMEGGELGLSGTANRVYWWINGLKEMAAHPWKLILGLGLGGFAYYSVGSPDTNNIYVWFFYDMGLFGVAVFFVFFAVLLKTLWRYFACGKAAGSYYLFLAAATAFLLEPGVHGLIELDWSMQGARLVWFPLAFMMAAGNVVQAEVAAQAGKQGGDST